MSNKIYGLLILVVLSLITFSSCSKENVDDTTNNDDDVDTEVVVCELEIELIEDGEGNLSANVTGANGSVVYEWSTGAEVNSIEVLSSTEYTVAVVDAEGCTAEASITTAAEEGSECDWSLTITENDGTLSVEVEGGTEPFVYVWSDGSTTASIDATPATTYAVTVTDGEGCILISEITTEDNTVDCNSLQAFIYASDGTVGIEVGGGTPPYLYMWSDGSTGFETDALPNTTYTVTVTDSQGCTVTSEITTENDCNSLNAIISPQGDGILAVEASGGTPPYVYAWSDGSMTPMISSMPNTTYTVTVTDAFGCIVISSFTTSDDNFTCDNSLTLNAGTDTPIDFSAASEGYLFKTSCSNDVASIAVFEYNYVIVDVTWDAWGTGLPMDFIQPSDGIPGITIGSNSTPQVGDVLTAYGPFEPLFNGGGSGPYLAYVTSEVVVTIEEAGDAVGEYIGGTISGTVTNQNDASDTATVTGSFCVPIVSVCE